MILSLLVSTTLLASAQDAVPRKVRTLQTGDPEPRGGHVWGLTPDGSRLVYCRENQVQVFECSTGKRLLTCDPAVGRLWRSAFSPDGKEIVLLEHDAPEWKLTGVSLETGKIRKSGALSGANPRNVSMLPNDLAFSRDGKTLYMAPMTSLVSVDSESLTIKALLPVDAELVRCHPDGKSLAVADHRKFRIVDAKSGKTTFGPKQHGEWIRRIELNSDGSLLVSVSQLKENSPGAVTLKVWDTRTGKELRTWTPPGSITRLSLSMKSDLMIVSTNTGVDGWVSLLTVSSGKQPWPDQPLPRGSAAVLNAAGDFMAVKESETDQISFWELPPVGTATGDQEK